MPRAKAFTRLELIRKLRQHDRQFEVDPKRAKGSEVMLFHPNVDGDARSYPVPGHNDGSIVRRGHLKAIVRRFNLPSDFFQG